jgi:hypothetical protein
MRKQFAKIEPAFCFLFRKYIENIYSMITSVFCFIYSSPTYFSDDPNMVIITPSSQSYTLKETENLNKIQCTADCKPVCTMTWSGPNLPSGTTSVLNLHNINRNQAGNYQCTASNAIGSMMSVTVTIIVNCKCYGIPVYHK